MGDHYVPQHYLGGFTGQADGRFWVYEKGRGKPFKTQPKSVANINDFYPDHLERHLAEDIEGPGSTVLDKIRGRHDIGPQDKAVLASYMTAMWKRGPTAKARIRSAVPETSRDFSEQLHKNCADLIALEPERADEFNERCEKVQAVLDQFAANPPDAIWHEIVRPDRTPRMIEALTQMNWTFLVFDERPAFLTCDNPLFIFTGIGVGRPESEVSFPICSHITLLGTWRTDYPQTYVNVLEPTVREINRRTADNALRFAFHALNEDWISGFINKRSWQLNPLNLIF